MVIDLASIVVQLFGAAICVASVLGLVMPAVLIGLVKKVAVHPSGFLFAVAVRILLGAALLTAAPESRFPAVFMVFGWVAIAAAIGLLFIGQRGMQRMVEWVANWSVVAVRVWLAIGAVFGVFLVYGVS